MRCPSIIAAILALPFLTAGVGAQTPKEILGHLSATRAL